MAFACLNVLVNWDKWESYCFGRTALIQLSVKSVERVQLTFLGNTKWMKNAIHGKQSYCIFLFRFNWGVLSISVLQFSSESNNFCHPPSLFCLQKICFCWCLVQLDFLMQVWWYNIYLPYLHHDCVLCSDEKASFKLLYRRKKLYLIPVAKNSTLSQWLTTRLGTVRSNCWKTI